MLRDIKDHGMCKLLMVYALASIFYVSRAFSYLKAKSFFLMCGIYDVSLVCHCLAKSLCHINGSEHLTTDSSLRQLIFPGLTQPRHACAGASSMMPLGGIV